MALIEYSDTAGEPQIYDVPWKSGTGLLRITIGSDEQNDLTLPADWGVRPHHAILTRARAPVSFVLLDLSNGESWVNDIPIVKMKALRHLDGIHFGGAALKFFEIHVETLEEESPYLGRRCMLYGTASDTLHAGEEIVICRCEATTHRGCWFQLPRCSTNGCWYPIQSFIRKRLAGRVFIQKVEQGSELRTKQCPAGQSVDVDSFQVGQYVLNCPGCSTPYHIACWLSLFTCTSCGYDVRPLTDMIFGLSEPDDEEVLEEL